MKRNIAAALGLLAYTASARPAQSSNITCPASDGQTHSCDISGRQYIIECGIDRHGGDANDDGPAYVSSFTDCMDSCSTTDGCVGVSYAPGTPGPCYRKKSHRAGKPNTAIWGARLSDAKVKATSSSANAIVGAASATILDITSSISSWDHGTLSTMPTISSSSMSSSAIGTMPAGLHGYTTCSDSQTISTASSTSTSDAPEATESKSMDDCGWPSSTNESMEASSVPSSAPPKPSSIETSSESTSELSSSPTTVHSWTFTATITPTGTSITTINDISTGTVLCFNTTFVSTAMAEPSSTSLVETSAATSFASDTTSTVESEHGCPTSSAGPIESSTSEVASTSAVDSMGSPSSVPEATSSEASPFTVTSPCANSTATTPLSSTTQDSSTSDLSSPSSMAATLTSTIPNAINGSIVTVTMPKSTSLSADISTATEAPTTTATPKTSESLSEEPATTVYGLATTSSAESTASVDSLTETTSLAASTSTECGDDEPMTTTDDGEDTYTSITTLFLTHTVVVTPTETTEVESTTETGDVKTDVITKTVTAYRSSGGCKTGCGAPWPVQSIKATTFFRKGPSTPCTTCTQQDEELEKRNADSSTTTFSYNPAHSYPTPLSNSDSSTTTYTSNPAHSYPTPLSSSESTTTYTSNPAHSYPAPLSSSESTTTYTSNPAHSYPTPLSSTDSTTAYTSNPAHSYPALLSSSESTTTYTSNPAHSYPTPLTSSESSSTTIYTYNPAHSYPTPLTSSSTTLWPYNPAPAAPLTSSYVYSSDCANAVKCSKSYTTQTFQHCTSCTVPKPQPTITKCESKVCQTWTTTMDVATHYWTSVSSSQLPPPPMPPSSTPRACVSPCQASPLPPPPMPPASTPVPPIMPPKVCLSSCQGPSTPYPHVAKRSQGLPAPPAVTQGPSPKCVVSQGENGNAQYVDTCRHITLTPEGFTPPSIMQSSAAPQQGQPPVAPKESHGQPEGDHGPPQDAHGQPQGQQQEEPSKESHGKPESQSKGESHESPNNAQGPPQESNGAGAPGSSPNGAPGSGQPQPEPAPNNPIQQISDGQIQYHPESSKPAITQPAPSKTADASGDKPSASSRPHVSKPTATKHDGYGANGSSEPVGFTSTRVVYTSRPAVQPVSGAGTVQVGGAGILGALLAGLCMFL